MDGPHTINSYQTEQDEMNSMIVILYKSIEESQKRMRGKMVEFIQFCSV